VGNFQKMLEAADYLFSEKGSVDSSPFLPKIDYFGNQLTQKANHHGLQTAYDLRSALRVYFLSIVLNSFAMQIVSSKDVLKVRF